MTGTSELTYTGVPLAVFENQVCLPFPSIVFLMAAGALSARGHMSTSIIVLLGVLGCLAADGIWFWLDRKWGLRVCSYCAASAIEAQVCVNI